VSIEDIIVRRKDCVKELKSMAVDSFMIFHSTLDITRRLKVF